eukprot:353707-Chlamydomonas_euryale.AAC.12
MRHLLPHAGPCSEVRHHAKGQVVMPFPAIHAPPRMPRHACPTHACPTTHALPCMPRHASPAMHAPPRMPCHACPAMHALPCMPHHACLCAGGARLRPQALHGAVHTAGGVAPYGGNVRTAEQAVHGHDVPSGHLQPAGARARMRVLTCQRAAMVVDRYRARTASRQLQPTWRASLLQRPVADALDLAACAWRVAHCGSRRAGLL